MTKQADVLKFTIGEDVYCVAIDVIEEVIRPKDELQDPEETDEETDAKLTNIPYSNDFLLGLMEFRSGTLEVIDPVGVFNLETLSQIKNNTKRKQLDTETQALFDDVESEINTAVKNNDLDQDVAKSIATTLSQIQTNVLQRPETATEKRNVTDKQVIVLDKTIGNNDHFIGLVVDSVADVHTVGPESLDTSIEKEGIIGVVKKDSIDGMMVWIDPVSAFQEAVPA